MQPRNISLAFAIASTLAMSSAAVAQSEGTSTLEEITVTAQRRAERLQDVPIAVSAFTSSELEVRNVTQALDLI
ncbi:MAG: hypothetical protein IT483_14480, partial [Gammaproteobacteria bacterium]|nr:hypothetical protein [Gammaproteobacteria bacterium]